MNRHAGEPLRFAIKSCVILLPILLIGCFVGCAPERPSEAVKVDSTTVGSDTAGSDTIGLGAVDLVAIDDTPATSPDTNTNTNTSAKPPVSAAGMEQMKSPNPADIQFKDNVKSNVQVPQGLDGLVFLDTNGKRVSLKSYLGKKNVVLVFTEGFAGGMLCPFCKTQTSRLVANYDKFAKLETQILVVYPGSREHLDEFVEAAKKNEKTEVDSIPFPLLLDKDLKAVSYFNISSNLAHPSTFIIDKSGNVRLAYVGADMTADRPSVASMLRVLESTTAQ